MEEVKKAESKNKTFNVNLQIYACEGTEFTAEDILSLIYDLANENHLIINGTVEEQEQYGY